MYQNNNSNEWYFLGYFALCTKDNIIIVGFDDMDYGGCGS